MKGAIMLREPEVLTEAGTITTSASEEPTSSAGAAFRPLGTRLRGFGSYLPDRIVSNDEVGAPAGVDDEWIHSKTGIRERRYAAPEQATSDLAIRAALLALADAGISALELSTIILATSTPDHSQPPTAAIVQAAIGADNAASFDLNAVCSGFEFALNLAATHTAAIGGTALVIGAETYSRILNPADRKTVILFGDGAGAAVIAAAGGHAVSDGHEIVGAKLRTYGELQHLIGVPMGGSRMPYSPDADQTLGYFQMDGRAVRDFVVTRMPGIIRDFLAELSVDPNSVKHLVPHQANGVMLAEMGVALDLPGLEQHLLMEYTGNTGAASIPIALARLAELDVINPGELVLLAGFGGGMSVGLTLIRW
jgi:3-oxoacyl-(acyl-carrier-protein) synthase III